MRLTSSGGGIILNKSFQAGGDSSRSKRLKISDLKKWCLCEITRRPLLRFIDEAIN